MKALLSLLGIDRRLRRARIALGEGVIAAEDRAQLLRMAWDLRKRYLKSALLLAVAVTGLTTVMVALLSVAVVVHFWDTPYRATAAWLVAALWLVLWLVALITLARQLKRGLGAFDPVRDAFERDAEWLHLQFRHGDAASARPSRRPETMNELLARIELQRERLATLRDEPASSGAQAAASNAPPDETPTEAVVRLAREHPVAAAAVTVVVVSVVGRRRLVRLGAWLVPILWKMR